MPKGVFALSSRNMTLDGNITAMGQWSDVLQETIREYACPHHGIDLAKNFLMLLSYCFSYSILA